MDYPVGCRAGKLMAGDTVHGFRTPVGAYIGEYLACIGKQMTEEHGDTVERIVLCSHHKGLAYSIPVE